MFVKRCAAGDPLLRKEAGRATGTGRTVAWEQLAKLSPETAAYDLEALAKTDGDVKAIRFALVTVDSASVIPALERLARLEPLSPPEPPVAVAREKSGAGVSPSARGCAPATQRAGRRGVRRMCRFHGGLQPLGALGGAWATPGFVASWESLAPA